MRSRYDPSTRLAGVAIGDSVETIPAAASSSLRAAPFVRIGKDVDLAPTALGTKGNWPCSR